MDRYVATVTRDVLIDLFERKFIEAQEDVGMGVIGHFRNADDPNAFVWVRAFADMESRARALAGFYDGATWQSHRSAANATLLDNDNVLLLRPTAAGAGFILDAPERPALEATGDGRGMGDRNDLSPRSGTGEGGRVYRASQAAHERFLRALDEMLEWRDSLAVALSARVREPQTLRLVPCARSLLHG